MTLHRRALLLAAALVTIARSDAWEVYRVHPFVEATADELDSRLRHPARDLRITTLQNDWLHEALAVGVTDEERATVTVELHGEAAITEHVRLRVVGFINQKDKSPSLDPIFDDPGKLDLGRHSKYMRNFANIHGFPTVTATAQDPVLIWLTADTRGLKPGAYSGLVRVSAGPGSERDIPLQLRVRPYALPEDNPLITQGWEWIPGAPTKEDGARLLYEYGINACHVDRDMRAARKAGFKFFMFVFAPSWKGKPPAEADEAAVDKRIDQIKALIDELKLAPHEWALYTIDEPNDKSVPTQVLWHDYILSKWPEARFVYNPGWTGPVSDPHQTVEGTIKPLAACADIWLPYSWWIHSGQRKGGLETMKATGKPMWFYEIMGFSYNHRPTVGRDMLRTLPWVAARYQLQGASWYSLNAYQHPWSNDPGKTGEYGCIYGTIPSRALEALRQGIQEYKRVHELRRLGVEETVIQDWAKRALGASRAGQIDRVRREMDDRLLAIGR